MDYETLWWAAIGICVLLMLIGLIKLTWAFWEGLMSMI